MTLSYQEIIAIQTAKNNIHSIFLNHPFGLLAHLAFETNLCPSLAISNNTTASHNTYENKLSNQVAILAGKSQLE